MGIGSPNNNESNNDYNNLNSDDNSPLSDSYDLSDLRKTEGYGKNNKNNQLVIASITFSINFMNSYIMT